MYIDTLSVIKNRRSIRAFKKEQIDEKDLQAVLEAGLYAPSARNEQPWHFTVIQDRKLLDRLTASAKEALSSTDLEFLQRILQETNFDFFYHAPTVILISGDKNAMSPHASCAAAAENILIAAESIGLGSCWINMPVRMLNSEAGDYYKKDLGIPEDFLPLYSVALGYKEASYTEAPARREGSINYVR